MRIVYHQQPWELPEAQELTFLKIWGQKVAMAARANARARRWREIPRTVQLSAVNPAASSITVESRHVAAAQRHYGGWIEAPGKGPYARHARLLTIPVSDYAKGKTRFEVEQRFGQLYLINTGKQLVLATAQKGRKGAKGGLDVHFVLKQRVYQRPQPWWPSEGDALRMAEETGRELAAREEK